MKIHFEFHRLIEILSFVKMIENISFSFSYPFILVLSKEMLDKSVKKVARCHKLQLVYRAMSLFLHRLEYLYLFGVYQVKPVLILNENVVLVSFSIEIIDADESESIDITFLSFRKTTHYSATSCLQNFLSARVLHNPGHTVRSVYSSMYGPYE